MASAARLRPLPKMRSLPPRTGQAPPPAAPGGAPKVALPAPAQDGRGDLMSAINAGGFKLKKTADRDSDGGAKAAPPKAGGGGGMADMLAAAMAERRGATGDSDDDGAPPPGPRPCSPRCSCPHPPR